MKKKHVAKDNMPRKYHDGFQKRKGRHEINNTKLEMGSNDVNNTPKKIVLVNMFDTITKNTVDIQKK